MGYFLGSLLSYVLLYKYIAVFGIVMTAGIIVPWPENTLMVAVGAFATQGFMNVYLTFAVAVGANIIGDLIGYSLTYFWGYHVIKEHHLKKYRSIEKANTYLQTNAGLTIFLTRFVGTLGPAVNFLSGLAGIPVKKFLLFDTIGNMLDIGIFLALGYALGAVWQNFSGIIDTLGWILSATTVLGLVIRFMWRKRSARPQELPKEPLA